MFRHIVVGCDGSPEGRDAVALGASIAAAVGARLSLVGVFPTAILPVSGVTDRKTARRRVMEILRRERDALAPGALIHAVPDSSVPRALRRQARRWHADLVIIGSSPAAADGHVAIGRHGRQLLHDVPFALAIAARGLSASPHRLRSIGTGFDGGPEAEAALSAAVVLARGGDAKLVVRRIVEPIVLPFGLGQAVPVAEWMAMEAEERRAIAAETISAVARQDTDADVSVASGNAGAELRALSAAVDLLVVGSRRWGTVARVWSGGVGETLVADASCSILIVPRPAAQPESGPRAEPAADTVSA